MSEFEIRPIEPNEFERYAGVLSAAFGWTISDRDLARWRAVIDFDRSLAAFDNSRMVGTAGIESFELTVPGGTVTPAAGVTAVTVLPTERRRGVLTGLMRRQLNDIRERGESIAILLSSESIIYGRFGYGLGTTQAMLEIDRRHAAFRRPAEDSGRVSYLETDAARGILPGIYDRARREQPGQVNRTDRWWEGWFEDPADDRDGSSARMYVVHQDAAGTPDGYAAYRIKADWREGFAMNTLTAQDLVATTLEAYAALWQYCLRMDLVTTVRAWRRPPDEPLRWMLADPRRLRFTEYNDTLWVRTVDIPAALSARCYGREDRLVLSVTDPFCPENNGRYELEGGPDGATCRRSDGECDIALHVDDVGAVYLGGVRLSTLARAGRVQELRSGALHRADEMFLSEKQPYCSNAF